MSFDLVVNYREKYSVLQDPDSSFTVNLRKAGLLSALTSLAGLIKRSDTVFALIRYQTLFDNKQRKYASKLAFSRRVKTRDDKYESTALVNIDYKNSTC